MSTATKCKEIAKMERRVEVQHWTARLASLKAEKAELKLKKQQLDAEIEGVEAQLRELEE